MNVFAELLSKVLALPQLLSRRADEKKYKPLILQSKLFDESYYAGQYSSDIAKSGLDPVTHYLRIGGVKGYNPSLEFDGSLYRSEYADVRKSRINPLVHYLRHGQFEGRPVRQVAPTATTPKAPTKAQWDELASLNVAQGTPKIDIVVPVYRGFHETANCLYQVLRSRRAGTIACELVVIDDASPEPAISALLDDLAGRGLLTLLRNKNNLGFVASVNRGMELHGDRDVVLLNSDTEVFGDWVDRLHRTAYSSGDIGTVTPLSNNATICSYPNFPGEFRGSFEVSFAEIDQLASAANAGMMVDVPTAIGFCMYIRRQCLAEAGLFDAETFGRGYGEENDFCLRIAARGWRNVLAGDVFVRHLGRVSFVDTTDQRIHEALKIINARYPHYLPGVGEYVKSDPPKKLRRNLDIARLQRLAGVRPVLFVLHNLGGGTLKHVRELSDRLTAEGIGVLWLQPDMKDNNFAVIRHAGVENLSNGVTLNLRRGLPEAIELIRGLGVQHIHVHHILGFAPHFTFFLKSLAEACGIQYDVTVHDYTFVCPRVTMIDGSGIYCGNVNVTKCEACVSAHGSPAGDVSVWFWRQSNEDFLMHARRVFVPNIDAKTRLNVFIPGLEITTREHPELLPETMAAPVVRRPGETLRVAIIGAIGPHKGSLLLLQCAQDALERRLPIEFRIFGFSDKLELQKLPNVSFSGKYREEELDGLLVSSRCHLAFFPALWPETYSYTLSQGWFAGLYPVAFDIGAIAERIRRSGWGHLLPVELMTLPEQVNDALLSMTPPSRPETFSAVTGSHLYKTIWGDYYEFDQPPPGC